MSITITYIPGTPPMIQLAGNIICDGIFGLKVVNNGIETIIPFSHHQNYPGSPPYWKATIINNFDCGSEIKVVATCFTNNKTNEIDSVTFRTPPCNDCPIAIISIKKIGDCDANRYRLVTFETVVTSPPAMAAFGQWLFYIYPNSPTHTPAIPPTNGPNIYVSQNSVSQPPIQSTFSFPPTIPGTFHTAVIRWNNPPHVNCPDIKISFEVDDCPICCPKPLNISITNVRDCVSQNPEFNFGVNSSNNCPLPPNMEYVWTITSPIVNGVSEQHQLISTAITANTNNAVWKNSGTNSNSNVPVNLSAVGIYTISVSFLNGNTIDCAPAVIGQFIINDCCPTGQHWDEKSKTCMSCPSITTPQVVITGTSPGGNASTTFETTISPASAASYSWEVTTPNGTIFRKTTSSPNTTDRTIDGIWASNNFSGNLDLNTPGSYVVKVTAEDPGILQVCSVTSTIGFQIPSTPAGCPTVATPTATVNSSNTLVTFSTVVTPAVASSFDWEVTTPGGAVFTKSTTASNTTNGITDGVWKNKSTGASGTLDISAPGSYKVTVNAVGATISTTCPPASPGNFNIPTTPPSTSITTCDVILWLSIILMLIGAILVILGCMLSIPAPQASAILFLVGWAVFGAGWLAFLFWLIFCSSVATCQIILQIRTFVGWLIIIFGVIAAIIAFIAIFTPNFWPCAGLATFYSLNWGFIRLIIDGIAEKRRCLIPNPAGGK